MQSIDIYKISRSDIDIIVNWYNQDDKGWLYCDDPDYKDSDIKSGLEYLYGLSPDDPKKIDYYLINLKDPQPHDIGFALVRKGFEYFKEFQGFSVGIDITESDERNKGCGSIAVRKLLLKLKIDRSDIKKIYLETLSYNVPMQRVAKKVGFRQIASKDVEAKYQEGFEEHIVAISSCLNIPTVQLSGQKVYAILYELDLANWSNDEL